MRIRVKFIFIDHILRIFLALLASFFAALFILFWCFRMDITAKGDGKIICSQWIEVKPEIDGIIKKMAVSEGDQVKQGNLLFFLEDRERKIETESSRQKMIEIRKTIANLRENISLQNKNITGSIEEARALLREAEAELNIIEKGPKTQEIRLAKRGIRLAGQQVEKASIDLKRMEKAFSLKLVSQQELDDVTHRKKLAQTELALAEDRLSLLLNKFDTDQKEAAHARLQRRKAVLEKTLARKQEIAILEQELFASQNALATEEKKLSALESKLLLAQVKAPISGIIMTYDTEHIEGKRVSKGDVVLKIGGTDDYLIECKVSEKDFPLVNPENSRRPQMGFLAVEK